jgi:hypothetical protein
MREIRGECGLKISATELSIVSRTTSPNGKLHLIFQGNLSEVLPDIKLSWEHDQYEWVAPNELLRRGAPPNADSFYLDVLTYIEGSRAVR